MLVVVRLRSFTRGIEFHGQPLEQNVAVAPASADIEMDRPLGVARPLPFSPLDALLGLDGSLARLVALVVWGAGDIVADAKSRSGKLRGDLVVDALQAFAAERQADLEKLENAAVGWLGDSTLPEHSDDELVEALADLKELAATVTVVPDYDDKSGPGLFELAPAYESDDLVALAAVEVMILGAADVVLRKCGHCERPFVMRHANEVYCHRQAPGHGITAPNGKCRDVGPQRRYADQLDGAEAIYRKTYKRLDNKVRRGSLTREQLDEWRERARKTLEAAQKNRWTNLEFESALRIIEPGSED